MNPIVGELLLAAVGLDAVLSPGEVRFTVATRNKAAGIPKRIKSEAIAYLHGPETFKKPSKATEFDFDAAIDRFTDGDFSLDQTLENMSGLDDPDEAQAFDTAYRRAYDYLRQLLPTRMRQTTCGPRPLPPTQQERATFRRAYAIANDPLSILDSMESGSISPGQARVLQALYPSIYAEIAAQFQREIIEICAEKPLFELPWGRDKVLQTFLQARVMNKALAKQMQASFAQDAQEQAQKKGAAKPAPGAEPTSIERITSK